MSQGRKNFAIEDQLSVRELLASLFAFWWVVVLAAVVAVQIGAYYIANIATPIYRSKSVFELPVEQSSGLSANSPFSALVGAQDTGPNIFDLLAGRDFILELSDIMGLVEDPFFNGTTTPETTRQVLMRSLRSRERMPPSEDDKVDNAVGIFRQYVRLSETPNGAYEVLSRHVDPQRAALVANETVKRLIQRNREEKIRAQRELVEYLSFELRHTREELDNALSAVQQFAVENSTLPRAELQQQSQLLVRLREQKVQLEISILALERLIRILTEADQPEAQLRDFLAESASSLSQGTSAKLGRPQTIQQWAAVTPERAEEILVETNEQLALLESNIAESESRARSAADSASELARLERDVEVASTTYEVIVEQFKAQSLASGLEVSSGTVFETAIPATGPAEPQRSLIIMLSLALGIIVGCILAMVLALSTGRMYSKRGLFERLAQRTKSVPFKAVAASKGVLGRLLTFWNNSHSGSLASVTYSLSVGTKTIVVFPETNSDKRRLFSFLSSALTSDSRSVYVLDLDNSLRVEPSAFTTQVGKFSMAQAGENVSVLRAIDPAFLSPGRIGSAEFRDQIEELHLQADKLVFLGSKMATSGYILEALLEFDPSLVMSTRVGRVKKATLESLFRYLQSAPDSECVCFY